VLRYSPIAHPEPITGSNPSALERIGEGVNAWLHAHRRSSLLAASLLCIATFSGYSHAKVPWMDEVLLITIAHLKTLRDIWACLMDAVQTDPPVLQSLVHFLFRFFGDHVFLARLPAILGFTLMCACLTVLVWRHVPPVYAAATFFLPYATCLRIRAMDARPYGLMMGLSALSLLCWDAMGDPQAPHRNRWRIAFTLALAATFSTHFYSILLLAPLAAAELTRWILRRGIQWDTPICIALALIPYGIWLPILLSGMRVLQISSGHYHGAVLFQNFANFYAFAVESLPLAALLLLLLLAAALLPRTQPVSVSSLSTRHRALLAAAAAFLLLPAIGFAAGVALTGFFINYYFMISAFGIILGLPLLLPAISGGNRVLGLCLLLAIAGQGFMVTARGLSGFHRRDAGYPTLASIRALIPDPHPDVIVPAPVHFMAMHEANRFDPENNLLFLYDRDLALAEIGTTTADLLYQKLRPYTDARIQPFRPYIAAHPTFYMAVPLEPSIEEWQYSYLLKRRHARFFWLGAIGGFDVFRVETQ
jgi:hypothetical protein